jgi:glycosyltransferase involved in cell wall biosynthesis
MTSADRPDVPPTQGPLRVAFDVGALLAPATGVGVAVAGMHAALARRSDIETVDYLLSLRGRPPGGVRRLPLPAALAHSLWARLGRPRADRWIGAPHTQVIHGTNYVVPPARTPRVVSVYDMWFYRHPTSVSPTLRRAGAVMAAAIRDGAHVHASSTATADAVRAAFPRAAVQVIHLGPPPLLTPPLRSPLPQLGGKPFALFVGTVERRKNVPALIRAFAQVADRIDDLQLVIAGSPGDDQTAADAAVHALPPSIARRVIFTGRVDPSAHSWLVKHAAVLAYPSLDEGFGFPLLEAFANGTPVVGSTAGSIPEIAGAAALLAAPNDIDGLAASLFAAIDDAGERQRLIDAGNERVQAFSWDRCADELAALYRRLT